MLELKEYDRAIKALKSLKNYCKRWQRYGETHLIFKNTKCKEMKGTSDFNQLLMSVYHQIGLVYREVGKHHAAIDYFKKQLIVAWQKDCIFNEFQAYHGIAIQNFYLTNKAGSLVQAHQCFERFYRGLREHKHSNLRTLYVAVLNSNSKNELMAFMAQENEIMRSPEEKENILYPIEQ